MHIPDGYLSPATCAALYGGSTPFWYVALSRVKKCAAYAPGALAVAVRRLLLRHHDVQSAAAGRHHGACRGCRDRGRRARSVGGHAGHLHRAGHPGVILRRRRHHGDRRELFQHGRSGFAGGLRCVSCGGGTRGPYVFAARSRGRTGGLRGLQSFGAVCCRRIRHSAAALQGRLRRSALLPVSAEHRRFRP